LTPINTGYAGVHMLCPNPLRRLWPWQIEHERVFGGATRRVLEEASIPVLMQHQTCTSALVTDSSAPGGLHRRRSIAPAAISQSWR
jgi:hypothetical protein